MGSFGRSVEKAITRPFKRAGREINRVYKRIEDEGHRADDILFESIGQEGPRKTRVDIRESEVRFERETTRIGPPSSILSGDLRGKDDDIQKRRRRFAHLTGGLGTLQLGKPGLLGV